MLCWTRTIHVVFPAVAARSSLQCGPLIRVAKCTPSCCRGLQARSCRTTGEVACSKSQYLAPATSQLSPTLQLYHSHCPLTGSNHWRNIMVWWSGVQGGIFSEIWTHHFNEKLTDKNTFNKDGWSFIFPCTFKTSWALQDLDNKRRDY